MVGWQPVLSLSPAVKEKRKLRTSKHCNMALLDHVFLNITKIFQLLSTFFALQILSS
jgi:hypothetical protein